MPRAATEAEIIELYRSSVGQVYGYVSRRCDGRRDIAEDVTQETWLRAVREWRQHGLPDEPLAWLTTVARNLLLNHARRAEPLPIDALPDVALASEPAGADPPGELATTIRAALTRLTPEDAGLLESFHFGRERVARLAERLGITERAVEGRLRRARERLRAELIAIDPDVGGP